MHENKGDAVLELVGLLRGRFGDRFEVVDHWEADRLALGVARSGAAQPLVHIRMLKGAARPRFFLALESPPLAGSDLPYTPAGEHGDISFSELTEIVEGPGTVFTSSLARRSTRRRERGRLASLK